MAKVNIYDIIKRTPGGFHSWVRSSVGVIRKPNDKIKMSIYEIIKEPEGMTIVNAPKISFLKRLWLKIISIFK